MSKNAQLALTAVNTAGLLALAGALALRGDPSAGGPERRPAPTDAEALEARVATLEQRLARLEGAGAPSTASPPVAAPTVVAADEAGAPPGPTPGAAATPDGPVTRSEVEALITRRLASRDPEASAPAAPAAPVRPRRPLREVARELGLDARQESAARELYRQLERDSMKVLFEVDDAGLEQLKAELALAEHDPRLKEQLRERLSINWARRSNEVGVLWVKLDARLRELLGPELLPRFYGFDVQPDEREFPDLMQMFFAPPEAEAERR